MPQFNIQLACDNQYYNDWASVLLESLHYHVPWISLHCHIVNPQTPYLLDYVNYSFENCSFISDDSRLGYLQAVRFLKAAEFKTSDAVVTLDADTICTRSFTKEQFLSLSEKPTVLMSNKGNRWLAGLVSFDSSNFRKDYAKGLLELPIEEWLPGWDQEVLLDLSTVYNFTELSRDWMEIGKQKQNSVFLTLKGDQKFTDKYLSKYHEHKINNRY